MTAVRQSKRHPAYIAFIAAMLLLLAVGVCLLFCGNSPQDVLSGILTVTGGCHG
jgi:hypothetical protein